MGTTILLRIYQFTMLAWLAKELLSFEPSIQPIHFVHVHLTDIIQSGRR
jgi:hypothetical protein